MVRWSVSSEMQVQGQGRNTRSKLQHNKFIQSTLSETNHSFVQHRWIFTSLAKENQDKSGCFVQAPRLNIKVTYIIILKPGTI